MKKKRSSRIRNESVRSTCYQWTRDFRMVSAIIDTKVDSSGIRVNIATIICFKKKRTVESKRKSNGKEVQFSQVENIIRWNLSSTMYSVKTLVQVRFDISQFLL